MKKEDLTLEVVHKYLSDNYKEDEIISQLDTEILEWVDSDWKEDGEYESEHDWYLDFGRGEAEDSIREDIDKDILAHFEVTHEEYLDILEEEVWDTVYEIFPQLDAG